MEIPKDWKKIKLDDLVNIVNGKSPSSYKFVDNGKYPFLKVDELNQHNKFVSESRFYTNEGESDLVPEGSLLFPKRGAAILNNKVRISRTDSLIDSNLMSVHPKGNGNTTTEYLYNLIIQEKLYKIADVSTIPQINNKHIKPFKVLVPPRHEQDLILEFLSQWDEAITKTEKLIQVKKQYKKGLMQRLLSGKVRFPEFKGEDWIEVKLGKVFKERKDIGYENLTLVAITTKKGVIDRDELERRDTSSNDKSKYKRILPGDIGYNTMRMWQGVSGYSEIEGIVSPAYTIVKPKEGVVDGVFMSFLFKYPPVIDLFRRYSQGLVNDTLNLKYNNFEQIKIKVPPTVPEQQTIASVFIQLDKEIAILHKKVDLLKKQKNGLMQKLLTGKVRVNNVEVA